MDFPPSFRQSSIAYKVAYGIWIAKLLLNRLHVRIRRWRQQLSHNIVFAIIAFQ